MEADIVTDMDDVGLAGSDFTRKGDGIIHELMGMMGLRKAQGIHHEDVCSLQIFEFLISDGFHIRDIGQGTNLLA
jgi:hypothetical protein